MNIPFNQFKASELSKDIQKVVWFSSEENKDLEKFVEKYLIPRLQIFHNQKEIYYIFEEEYIETEWKDMISLHYINTSYQTRRTVMRVQLFEGLELSNEKYLGFFTLRSIDETEIMLSYVYPNWKNLLKNFKENCYFMTFKKRVHIYGKELVMHTYPLFVQDSAVTSCSHASMISMSKYLKGKYNYNHIRILDINSSYTYGRKKLYPTPGLDALQMLEILDANGIPVDYKLYSDKNSNAVRSHIDFCIESAMPVLLGIRTEGDEHVIQVIGHTLDENGEKKYIIYDDSGYYIAHKNKLKDRGASFVDIVSWEEIKDVLCEENKDEKTECGFIMYPLHEKIYILYDEVYARHFDKHVKRLQETGVCKNDIRVLIVDNNIVKACLSKLLIIQKSAFDCQDDQADEEYEKEVEQEIERLLSKNLPHFIWVLEVRINNGNRSVVLIDPTFNPITRKSIFMTETPITLEEPLSLLNSFD